MSKRTVDLQKGDEVLLNYGDQNGDLAGCDSFERTIMMDFHNSSYKPWTGIVKSKPRGKHPKVVFLEVHGWETEMGDTYAYKIIGWKNPSTGTWDKIELTPEQLAFKKEVESMGF